MRSIPLMLLIGLVIQTGCLVAQPPYSAPTESAPETVYVLPFERKGDLQEYDGPTDFEAAFGVYVAGALQQRGVPAIAIAGRDDIPDDARNLVRGVILEMDPGSLGLRVFPGFGVGSARVGAYIQLEDLQDNERRYFTTFHVRSLTWRPEEQILRRIAANISRTAALGIARNVDF